jgi:hypothetical protein
LEEVGKKIGLDKSALGRIETGDTPYDIRRRTGDGDCRALP